MHITISLAISSDGYMDDTSSQRLILSNSEDFHEVDILRSESDAILIGAETLRKDNPSLLIKDPKLIEARQQKGFSMHPAKVVLTKTGNIDTGMKFFLQGNSKKIIFTGEKKSYEKVVNFHEIYTLNSSPQKIVAELEQLGISKLLIEGGANILHQFLAENMIDCMRISVSPLTVGKNGKTKFLDIDKEIYNMTHNTTKNIGNMKVHYFLKKHAYAQG